VGILQPVSGAPMTANGMVRPCSGPASKRSWPRGTKVKEHAMSQKLKRPLIYQARKDVDRAASRETDDDTHRARRIGLRPSKA
jgi:hypothetical protein